MCEYSEQQKHQNDLLLEEWKQNVALYIDQDKRGFARIQIFLALHAGLLVIFQSLFAPAKLILAVIALYMTGITQRMSRRAHNYSRLRIIQAMLIEDKLKQQFSPDSEWATSSGILTTFSREHAVFAHPKEVISERWRSLQEEIKNTLGSFPADPFFGKKQQPSMAHLAWLMEAFKCLYFLWGVLFLYTLLKMILGRYNVVTCLVEFLYGSP